MRLTLISLLLLCFVSFTSDGEEADLLIVAAEQQMLQYQENGIHKGTTNEMLAAILSASELSGNIEYMPWARAFNIVQNRPNTLILSMFRTPQREQNFHWLLKVSESARVFISLKSKPENKVFTEQQAKDKTIAVVRGSHADTELTAKGFRQENIYLVASNEQMFSLFFSGKVDLVYNDPNTVISYFNHQDNKQVPIDYAPITPSQRRDSYIAANSKTSPAVLYRLQLAISSFKHTPKYQYLLKKQF